MGLSRTEALRASIDGFMHRVRKMIFALGERPVGRRRHRRWRRERRMKSPLITARTSLIATTACPGDLSILIWSILGSPLTSTLASSRESQAQDACRRISAGSNSPSGQRSRESKTIRCRRTAPTTQPGYFSDLGRQPSASRRLDPRALRYTTFRTVYIRRWPQ
jgi:hypothetical protein